MISELYAHKTFCLFFVVLSDFKGLKRPHHRLMSLNTSPHLVALSWEVVELFEGGAGLVPVGCRISS